MPNLNKTIERAAKIMEKEAKAQLRSYENTKWNGFEILAVSQWRMVLFGANPSDAAKSLPDDYTQDSMALSIFVDRPEFENWWRNWIEFLTSRKNPKIGKSCCNGCILNYELGPIGRYVLKKHGLQGRCQITNVFLCPYEEKLGSKHLVFAGKASQIVERVLLYPAKQQFYDLQKTFKVDFSRNTVSCFSYPGDTYPFEGTIQDQLVPMSELIVLDGPADYAGALADERLFSKIFDQYCDFVQNGSRYYGRKTSSSNTDEIRQTKDEICSFVRELDVGSDVLAELHQTLLEYTRKEKDNFDEHKKMAIAADPVLFRDIIENDRNGTCSFCNEFGNIKCTSCSTWLCKEHWKAHKLYNCKLL